MRYKSAVNWTPNQVLAAAEIKGFAFNTIKSYKVWIRKFQLFIKNKNYDELSQQDAIYFLSFLTKEVSVSII